MAEPQVDKELLSIAANIAADDPHLRRVLAQLIFNDPEYDMLEAGAIPQHLRAAYGLSDEQVEVAYDISRERIMEEHYGQA